MAYTSEATVCLVVKSVAILHYNTYNSESPYVEEYHENDYKTTAGIQATVVELISMVRGKDEDIRKFIDMLQEKDTLIKTLI